MSESAHDPKAIFQDWLDKVSGMIIRDDFDAFADMVALPCIVASQTNQHLLAEADQLRAGFDGWRGTLTGHGATDFVRVARDISQRDPGHVSGIYETTILRNGTHVVPSYTSWMRLRHQDGRWKCTHVVSGLVNPRFPFNVLQVDPGSSAAPPPLAKDDDDDATVR